ncbi:nitrite reductase [NAD(P)H], small subunit [Methylococcus capsulatus str. Bath]|uniref:Nitrite reductase [NAD(P)H], small subunit n=2 Tax=Methylococcaceae TaxID=403 RepID=Q60B89_METCA|nr:nitrite reductase [NAD(P)H], small subunit [Methylococcus capsulatus str. Bath]QXP88595.1 nitrite reductase small subunit NirD [Methylococcus capsulatus]QXP94391.1 nitrite reductase small subunit NirD [Methylococcus capsulatus]
MPASPEESAMTPWTPIARLEEIPRQGARVVATPEGAIAVFRTLDDRVFALLDRCPHKGGPLSQGIVHGARVACPLHNWVIELDSGQAVAPDEGCVRRFETRLEDGMVAIALPDSLVGT